MHLDELQQVVTAWNARSHFISFKKLTPRQSLGQSLEELIVQIDHGQVVSAFHEGESMANELW
jgi:hypothetical protein